MLCLLVALLSLGVGSHWGRKRVEKQGSPPPGEDLGGPAPSRGSCQPGAEGAAGSGLESWWLEGTVPSGLLRPKPVTSTSMHPPTRLQAWAPSSGPLPGVVQEEVCGTRKWPGRGSGSVSAWRLRGRAREGRGRAWGKGRVCFPSSGWAPWEGWACVGAGSADQGGVRDLCGGAVRARVAELERRSAAWHAHSVPRPLSSLLAFLGQ